MTFSRRGARELIFIQDRCTRSETANEKQIRKRASGGKHISHEGSLRNLEEIRADLWWERMENSDLYLRQMVMQNHQQNLNYPLYVPYGAMSPVLAAEPKGIPILNFLIKLFYD